jgi:hypothetical protein
LTNSFTGKITQKTYAKYLVEVSLNRQLTEHETVDHIDRNKLNDVLSNLQVLPKKEHVAKDLRKCVLISFNCPICNIEFKRSAKSARDHNRQNHAGPFCSASCRGKYGKQVQSSGKMFNKQKYIESEFYYPNDKESD